MKNYFENDKKTIMPFENVKFASIVNNKEIRAYGNFIIQGVDSYLTFPIEQLADYKQWIELKQQALVNKANPMLSIGRIEQAKNPEITEELLTFLNDHCQICKKNQEDCLTCYRNSDSGDLDETYDCYEFDTEKLVELNRKWQES